MAWARAWFTQWKLLEVFYFFLQYLYFIFAYLVMSVKTFLFFTLFALTLSWLKPRDARDQAAVLMAAGAKRCHTPSGPGALNGFKELITRNGAISPANLIP